MTRCRLPPSPGSGHFDPHGPRWAPAGPGAAQAMVAAPPEDAGGKTTENSKDRTSVPWSHGWWPDRGPLRGHGHCRDPLLRQRLAEPQGRDHPEPWGRTPTPAHLEGRTLPCEPGGHSPGHGGSFSASRSSGIRPTGFGPAWVLSLLLSSRHLPFGVSLSRACPAIVPVGSTWHAGFTGSRQERNLSLVNLESQMHLIEVIFG